MHRCHAQCMDAACVPLQRHDNSRARAAANNTRCTRHHALSAHGGVLHPTPAWPCMGRALGPRCAGHPPLRRRQEDRGVHARGRARLRRRLPRGRRAELTRTPRRLRWVRTGYAYQPPALCTYRRRRAACPQGPTYSTYWVRVPASGVAHVPRTVAPQVGGWAALVGGVARATLRDALLRGDRRLYAPRRGARRQAAQRRHAGSRPRASRRAIRPSASDGTSTCGRGLPAARLRDGVFGRVPLRPQCRRALLEGERGRAG